MELNIATHNKIFHADEVTAIALLKIFTDKKITIHRVDHQTDNFDKYDMVIDISRTFDGKKFFDHHQFKGGKSSAGMIWDYIGLQDEYPKISKLIKKVDDHDVGIQKSLSFEYSSLIKCYNHKDIYSLYQDNQFEKAVEFAMTVINSLKEAQDESIKAQLIINDSSYFEGHENIIELKEYTGFWNQYINGETKPHIKAVVWEDKDVNQWKVQIPPKKVGSFELNGKELQSDENMIFVHSGGFFAVAEDKKSMKNYILKQI